MAYPDDGPPRLFKVLEALRTKMLELKGPTSGYYHHVAQARVFEGDQLVLGRAMPAVVIAPTTSFTTIAEVACEEVTQQGDILIVGAVKRIPGDTLWKKLLAFFLTDIEKAIATDRQLGGLAQLVNVTRRDLIDAHPFPNHAICQIVAQLTYVTFPQNPD